MAYWKAMRAVVVLLAFGMYSGSASAQVCGSADRPESGLLAQDTWSCSTGGLISLEEGATFWKACRGHDICYWNPLTSRAECDGDFHSRLKSECGSAFHTVLFQPCRVACDLHAYAYFRAVSDNGHDSFTQGHIEGQAVMDLIAETDPDLFDLGPDVVPFLGARIGEGCFIHNDENSVCRTAKAAEHAVSRARCHFQGKC